MGLGSLDVQTFGGHILCANKRREFAIDDARCANRCYNIR